MVSFNAVRNAVVGAAMQLEPHVVQDHVSATNVVHKTKFAEVHVAAQIKHAGPILCRVVPRNAVRVHEATVVAHV